MPGKRSRIAEVPFQMAPMIDMVFLLLVFFMTVSTLAKDARPELELPLSATARVPEATPPREILSVGAGPTGHRFYWGSQEVNEEDLPPLLKRSREQGCGELLLRGGPELPWEAWQGILRHCRAAGFGDIVFATFEE
jgi:biopolymer transport protein ExbD